MGRVLCRKHGKQGFYEVCEHIHDSYSRDIYPQHHKFALAELYWIFVCDDCWRVHNLDRFREFSEMSEDEFVDSDENSKRMKDEWRKIYESLDRRCSCVECVAEVKVKQARKNGKPEPFPVFERTLTERQEERIENLEKQIAGNFSFQESVYWKSQYQNRPAFSVRAGAFTYPLTIKIYYFIDENEQNKIIDFVNKFLENIELNQAKIEFWEAENWIATETRFGLYSYHRGEEKLLREVYLNC